MNENTGKAIELKKFIPEALATFEGSAGYGGQPSDNPVESAKKWAIANNATNTNQNDCIVILDTQTPEWAGNKTVLIPEYKESNDYNLSWYIC